MFLFIYIWIRYSLHSCNMWNIVLEYSVSSIPSFPTLFFVTFGFVADLFKPFQTLLYGQPVLFPMPLSPRCNCHSWLGTKHQSDVTVIVDWVLKINQPFVLGHYLSTAIKDLMPWHQPVKGPSSNYCQRQMMLPIIYVYSAFCPFLSSVTPNWQYRPLTSTGRFTGWSPEH